MRAVVALGSNLGDRLLNLKNAVGALKLLPDTRALKLSEIYETEPWGYEAQSCFLNAAALIETGFSARALLGACLGIEAGLGRVRGVRNGPRVIDLDLLFYGSRREESGELRLPHPGVFTRAFVLAPLADLFPEHSVFGFDLSGAYAAADFGTVKKYGTFGS